MENLECLLLPVSFVFIMSWGWLLILKFTQEILDIQFFAFQEYFYPCVSTVAHVACQPVEHCDMINEGAETDALNDACNINSNSQG